MNTPFLKTIALPLRFIFGILLILGLSLVIFYLTMTPPMNEIGLMAGFLSVTALISALVGYGAYRFGWINRAPTLLWSLLGSYLLASALTFLNVWFSAQLMFTEPHDLSLAIVLLIFASGIAVVLGYFLANALTDRIARLERAAHRIAQGDLQARVDVEGVDEVAGLSNTFNQMAAQLQLAADKQRQLEVLRRELIAWSSHDLQTPLASVSAIVEALADGVVEDSDTIQRYLRTAQKEIRSLSALIDDLFQMAQLDAGGLSLTLENGSIGELISETLDRNGQDGYPAYRSRFEQLGRQRASPHLTWRARGGARREP
jgi:signal transduction histidine kinase